MRMLLAGIMIVLATAAHAHQAPSGFTYEPFCCNGDGKSGDCQRISSKTVRPGDGGYIVTLLPGDHRLVTRKHVFSIPQAETRESLDGHLRRSLNTPAAARIAAALQVTALEPP